MNRSISTPQALGRMELAQAYFPAITPRAAWRKLKSLLEDSPATAPLLLQHRRTFLPCEVETIYATFGAP